MSLELPLTGFAFSFIMPMLYGYCIDICLTELHGANNNPRQRVALLLDLKGRTVLYFTVLSQYLPGCKA